MRRRRRTTDGQIISNEEPQNPVDFMRNAQIGAGKLTFSNNTELAQIMRNILQETRMSQAELAEKAGITRAALSSYITGKAIPSDRSLRSLSKALNCDLIFTSGSTQSVALHDNERLEIMALQSDPKRAALVIHKVVPLSLALQVVSLLDAYDGSKVQPPQAEG